MPAAESSLQQSPLVFLKRIAVVELILTTFLMAAVALPQPRQAYDLGFGAAVSYYLFVAAILTLIRVIVIAVVFVGWYFPRYRTTAQEMLWRRSPWHGEDLLFHLADVTSVDSRQGWLAQRLNYGTLAVRLSGHMEPAVIRNVADPSAVKELLHKLAGRADSQLALAAASDIGELLQGGENQHVEYKASLMWDYRRQAVNKELYEPVMKNLVGFMNAAGGVLLIGVSDEGGVLGIEQDLSTLKKPNVDGFENIFNMAFASMVGVEHRQFVGLTFPKVDEKTLCLVRVQPANRPVFLRYQSKEEFYIRAGNSSQALPISRATEYIQGRFT